DQLAIGHEAGMRRLLMNHQLMTEVEEIERYADYCAAVLEALGISTTNLDARDLARQMVQQVGIEPFADTLPALERFKARNLRLAIISNGWPSLDRQLREVGLRHYFDPLIISAHVGSRKPEPRIFEVALELLGADAGSVLLVDDAVENVAAARAMGMQGVVIARGDVLLPAGDLPWVRSLAELDVR
ncbi:MAG TPA: HAD-IA family hydrolase, partial [Nitrolancea sp.]|nr:HAD-IA family hydrolase [Nitrolancea sp.]